MKNIKYLEEELVSQGKNLLENYWHDLTIVSECSSTLLGVKFTDNNSSIVLLRTSIHPMDTPWRLSSWVTLKSKELGDIEEIVHNEIKDESKYELYPILLNDEKKMNNLIKLIMDDLKVVLENQGFNKKKKSRFLLDN